MLQAKVFTLYPEIFPGPLNKGLYGKAMTKNLWSLNVINIRATIISTPGILNGK